MSLKELITTNKDAIFKYVVGTLIISIVGGTWSAMKYGFSKYEENHIADVRRDSIWHAKIERLFTYPSIDSADHVTIHTFMDSQTANNTRYDTTLISHNRRILILENYFK